jgi:hypothetical protein
MMKPTVPLLRHLSSRSLPRQDALSLEDKERLRKQGMFEPGAHLRIDKIDVILVQFAHLFVRRSG